MIRLTTGVAALALALSLAGSATAAHKAAKSVKCPKCGMMMPTKKTAAAPKAVKVNGRTYYCCTKCGYKGQTTK